MIALRAAYEERLRGEFRKSMSDEEAEETVDLEKEVADKLAEIIALQGLVVELVGRWLWVTGDTFPARGILKSAGFSWASKKLAWFWHKPGESTTSRGKKSLEEIRNKYGSRVIGGGKRSFHTLA